MKITLKILAFILVLFLFTMIYIPSIYAHPMDDFWPDDDAGWTLYEQSHKHMGFIQTTYKYYDATIKENYEEYFNSGIGMWGDLITMTETSLGNIGGIYAEEMPGSNTTATTNIHPDWPGDHVTKWEITINPLQYDPMNDEAKYRTMAHEIGHVYGLHHVPNTGQIMWSGASETKNVTDSDRWGMKVCTEEHSTNDHTNFSYIQYNETQHKEKCGLCKGYYLENHTWTDENDTTCNDCGYIRSMEIYEEDELLKVNLDGQVWVLNYSEEGTEYEWSQYPPKLSEMHGYSSSYNLPGGGTLIWNDIGIYIGETFMHRYCYNYNGVDYYIGEYNRYHPQSFLNLRILTHIIRSGSPVEYILCLIDSDRYHNQWYETAYEHSGIFWYQLYGDEQNGYYIVLKRGLVRVEDDSITAKGGDVWTPELRIPVYFSE